PFFMLLCFRLSRPLSSTLFPYTTLFRSKGLDVDAVEGAAEPPYTLPNIRVEYVRQEPPGVPTAFWRGVGPTHNIFVVELVHEALDRKSTRLNSSHGSISYAVFCLKKKKK